MTETAPETDDRGQDIEIEIYHYEDGDVDRGTKAYANGRIITEDKEIRFSTIGFRADELPNKFKLADGSRWDWDHETCFEITGTSEETAVASPAVEYFDDEEYVEELKDKIEKEVNKEFLGITGGSER